MQELVDESEEGQEVEIHSLVDEKNELGEIPKRVKHPEFVVHVLAMQRITLLGLDLYVLIIEAAIASLFRLTVVEEQVATSFYSHRVL